MQNELLEYIEDNLNVENKMILVSDILEQIFHEIYANGYFEEAHKITSLQSVIEELLKSEPC